MKTVATATDAEGNEIDFTSLMNLETTIVEEYTPQYDANGIIVFPASGGAPPPGPPVTITAGSLSLSLSEPNMTFTVTNIKGSAITFTWATYNGNDPITGEANVNGVPLDATGASSIATITLDKTKYVTGTKYTMKVTASNTVVSADFNPTS